MIPKIFDMVNKKVIINENCLLIPSLKAVTEYYKDPIPALSFIKYYCEPNGAYVNIPEDVKQDRILRDFPGDYSLEDEVMIDAIADLKGMYMTPLYRFYLDNKKLIENLGRYSRTAKITSGRDGNYAAVQSQLKSVGKIAEDFVKLEALILKEMEDDKVTFRGNRRVAYDE